MGEDWMEFLQPKKSEMDLRIMEIQKCVLSINYNKGMVQKIFI